MIRLIRREISTSIQLYYTIAVASKNMTETDIKLDHPIFIVGCPRSGTTKLASILNKHSHIAAATETHFFNFVSKQKFDWKSFNINDLKKLLSESRIMDFTKLGGLESQEILDQFSAISRTQECNKLSIEEAKKKEIFNLLVKNYLSKKNKLRICEKTPQHLQNISEILKLYPQAKIILMVRDGRDTVNSLIKMPWRPSGLINNARFWIQYLELGTREGSRPEVLTVKYEDLLANPEHTLRQICDFLGEEFEASLLTEDKESENLFSSWESSWKHKSQEGLDPSRVSAWKRELSPDEQVVLEWTLYKALVTAGYSSERPKLKPRHWLKILLEYLGITWRKLVRTVSHISN